MASQCFGQWKSGRWSETSRRAIARGRDGRRPIEAFAVMHASGIMSVLCFVWRCEFYLINSCLLVVIWIYLLHVCKLFLNSSYMFGTNLLIFESLA